MGWKEVIKTLWSIRGLILTVITPVVLLPVISAIEGDAGKCAYAILIMVIFWILEVFPIGITSLLPVVLFPILGILSAKQVAEQYVKETTFIVLGIFCVAAGIERWNLHKRLSLKILLIFGTKPHWLILGLLVCNVFLSMWMSAGVAVMMIPIMTTLVDRLNDAEAAPSDIELSDIPVQMVENGAQKPTDYVKASPDPNADSSSRKGEENLQLYKALSLCIAYGTSLGSTATLIGGPANLVMQGLADQIFEEYGLTSGITFGSWFVYAFPMVVIITIFVWLWFIVLFLKCRGFCVHGEDRDDNIDAEERVKKHIRQEYSDLGTMSYPEIVVLADLIILIIFYITKNLYFAPGWDSVFKKGYIGSSAPTIVAAMVLFVVPAASPRQFIRNREFIPIITWKDVSKTVPWGVIWLIGAGFSLALATQKSGLSAMIGSQFSVFSDLEPWVMTLILSIITAFLTEVTSNGTTIILLVPIVAQLGIQLKLHPMSLIFPITMAAKFAFMTPISSPPNAIVFSMGGLRFKDMAVAGFVVNLICLLVLNVGSQTWGRAYFGWDVFPEAMLSNRTLADIAGNGTMTRQTF